MGDESNSTPDKHSLMSVPEAMEQGGVPVDPSVQLYRQLGALDISDSLVGGEPRGDKRMAKYVRGYQLRALGGDHLVVKGNVGSPRFGQIGWLVGPSDESPNRIRVAFGDGKLDHLDQTGVKLIRKADLREENGIIVDFHDDPTGERTDQGRLLGYEKNDKGEIPLGWYRVRKADGQEVRVEENGSVLFSSKFRLRADVPPTDTSRDVEFDLGDETKEK